MRASGRTYGNEHKSLCENSIPNRFQRITRCLNIFMNIFAEHHPSQPTEHGLRIHAGV